MQTRTTQSTHRTTILLGTLCLVFLLTGPPSAFGSTEPPTVNLEEWETDVLGLVEECTPLASQPWVEEDGFLDSAIEEWETDVLGIHFCAAFDVAHLASQIEDSSSWDELSTLQIECVVAHLVREH